MNVFELLTVLGKRIRLTKTQWAHVTRRHPELEGQERKIKHTLVKPDFVLYSKTDDNYQYYRFWPKTPVGEKHLLVICRYLNSEGFVVTAFFLRKVIDTGKEIVYEK